VPTFIVDVSMLPVKHVLHLVERPVGSAHHFIEGDIPRALRRGCPRTASGSSTMASLTMVEVVVAPIWGYGEDAPADGPIGQQGFQ
jgi:hypothetical protein